MYNIYIYTYVYIYISYMSMWKRQGTLCQCTGPQLWVTLSVATWTSLSSLKGWIAGAPEPVRPGSWGIDRPWVSSIKLKNAYAASMPFPSYQGCFLHSFLSPPHMFARCMVSLASRNQQVDDSEAEMIDTDSDSESAFDPSEAAHPFQFTCLPIFNSHWGLSDPSATNGMGRKELWWFASERASWGGSGIIQFRMPASWFSIFFTATHWCSSVKQVSHCEHILASCCRCGHLSWKASSKVRSNVLTNRWFSGYVQWFQLQSSITQQEQGLVTIPRCLGGWVQTERFVEDDMLVLDVGNLHRYIYIHIYIYTYL